MGIYGVFFYFWTILNWDTMDTGKPLSENMLLFLLSSYLEMNLLGPIINFNILGNWQAFPKWPHHFVKIIFKM